MDNRAEGMGGAIVCSGSAPKIEDCEYIGNSANYGGALQVSQSSTAEVVGCRFLMNTSDECGGAVFSWVYNSSTFEGCLFRGNVGHGAAVVASGDCNPAFSYCTFENNQGVASGGGITIINGSAATVENCTFHGNSGAAGAHIYLNAGSAVTVGNSILAFAEVGVAVRGWGSVTLTCCDVFGNAGGDWVGAIADQAGINGNICADPMFCSAPEDLRIHVDSPCAPFSAPNPECDLIGAHPAYCGWAEIGANQPHADVGLMLGRPQPNPFHGSTSARFVIPQALGDRPGQMAVIDLSGRLVRTLAAGSLAAGQYGVTWKGINDFGRQVEAGVYFLKLEIGGQVETRRAVLVR
jgi:hypothetical protein